MNEEEFLNYLKQHLTGALGEVTLDYLKRWKDFGVLRPKPEYHKDDIHMAMSLMQMEQSLQKQAPTQGIEQQKPVSPPTTMGGIYQILSILGEGTSEEDMKEKAIVRLALLRSGLISTLGFVYINFSPVTGDTLDSILARPGIKSSFEKASASKELLIHREAIQFIESETGKEPLTALTPVLFILGVKPTVIYSSFIFGSNGRLLGPDQYVPLPRPLYEEFLDANIETLDNITNFMVTHLMIGSLGVPYDKNGIDFIKTTQEKMTRVLMKATKGVLAVADLSPFSPFHEDDIVEANKLGKMGEMDIFGAGGEPVSAGEIKVWPKYKLEGREWVPYDKSKLHIRRYYNWLDFMWAELIDAVTHGSQTPVCLDCGKLLPQKNGRRKTYCGPENQKCYRARKTEYVHRTRSRSKMM